MQRRGAPERNDRRAPKSVAKTSRNIRKQAAEMMWAAPQVVAHRLGQFALAGPMPNAKDTREFHLMSAEKIAAFGESWNVVGVEFLKMQQQVALDSVVTS